MYVGVTLVRISPKWAGVFAVVQIMIGALQRRGVKKVKVQSKECLVYENEFQKNLNEELNEMHAIRFENLGSDVVAFAAKNLERIKQKRLNQSRYLVRLSTVSKGVMYLGKMLLFFGMGYEVLRSRITMKEYIIFYSYMTTFTGNYMSVIQMLTTLQPMLLNVRRIQKVIHTPEQKPENKLPLENVEFIDAEKSFGEKVLFSDVNLKLNLEKSHAILGANGAGKTTFVKMLMKEEEATKGTMLIDGELFGDIQNEEVKDICYFAAKPCVFSGMTIRENLLLGIEDKQMEEQLLGEVCEDFLFHNDVTEMEHAMETVLGKEVNLSSGQMKKIELIRAALSPAEVVVLDEPMANMDEEFKEQFKRIFEKYFRKRKVIILEHDASRVSYVDNILNIEGGTIKFL